MSFKRYFTYVEPVEIAQADNKKAFKRTCNGFVLQMAHFYSKKSIVKKFLQNITK